MTEDTSVRDTIEKVSEIEKKQCCINRLLRHLFEFKATLLYHVSKKTSI